MNSASGQLQELRSRRQSILSVSSGQLDGQKRRDSVQYGSSGSFVSVERPPKRSSVLRDIVSKFCGQGSYSQGQSSRSSTLGRYARQRRESVLRLPTRENRSSTMMTSKEGAKLNVFGGSMLAVGSLASQDSVASNLSLSVVFQRVARGVMFMNRLKKLCDSRAFRTILDTPPEDRTEWSLTRIAKMLHGIPFFDRLNPTVRMKCCQCMRHLEKGRNEIIFEEGDPGHLFYVILEGAVAVHILPSGTTAVTRRACLSRRAGYALPREAGAIRRSCAAAAAFVSQHAAIRASVSEKVSKVPSKAEDESEDVDERISHAQRQRRRIVNLLGLQRDQQAATNDLEKQLRRIGGSMRHPEVRHDHGLTNRASATAEQPHARMRESVLSSADHDGASSDVSSIGCERSAQDSEVHLEPAALSTMSEEKMELHYGRRVAVLQRGNVFGEVSLEMDKPRTATVRTLKTCQFGVLHRDEFQNILKGVLEAEKVERLAFLKTVPLFTGWSEAALDEIAPLFHQRDLKKKDCLFDEGGAALQVYFIRDGEFELRRRPEHSLPNWHTKMTPWRRRRSLWCTVAIAIAPNAIGLLDALSEVHTYSERAVCRTASGRVYGILGRELDSRLDTQARQQTIDSMLEHEEFAKGRMNMLQHFARMEGHHNSSQQKASLSHHQQQTCRPTGSSNIYDAETRLRMIACAGGAAYNSSSSSDSQLWPSSSQKPKLHLPQKPHLTSVTPFWSPNDACCTSTTLAAAVARSVSPRPSPPPSRPLSAREAPSQLAAPRVHSRSEDGRWGSLLHTVAWSEREFSPCIQDHQRRPPGHRGVHDSVDTQISSAGMRLPGRSSEPFPMLLGGAALSKFRRKLDSCTTMRPFERP